MSNIIVITAEMYKVAEFSINVKYRRPGNVVEYVPVEFEIFRDGEYFKAIPMQNRQTKILTDLPAELLFKVRKGRVYIYTSVQEEAVEDVVSKLVEMKIIENPKRKLAGIKNKSSR